MAYWKSKPPFGTQLDRRHPLSLGLVADWLVSEGAGGVSSDMASGLPFTLSASGKWKPNTLGTALTITSGLLASAPSNALWKPTTQITVIWAGQYNLPGTGIYAYGCVSGINGFGLFRNGNSLTATLAINGAQRTLAFFTVKNFIDHTIVQTYDGKNYRGYYNGSLLVTSAQTGSIGQDTTTGLGMNASDAAGTNGALVGYLNRFMIYNRALSSSEIANWYTTPYDMYLAPVWKRYFIPKNLVPFSDYYARRRRVG